LQPRAELFYGSEKLDDFQPLGSVLPVGKQPIELTFVKMGINLEVWQELVREGREYVFRSAPDVMRADPEIVSFVMQGNPRLFQFALGEVLSNRELALAAVRRSGLLLQYVTGDARCDREILLTACRQSGSSGYMYVPEKFKSDHNMMLAAITGNGRSFSIVDEKLLNDREFLHEAIRANWKVFYSMPEQLRADRSIVLLALHLSGESAYEVLKLASKECHGDHECIAEAVRRAGPQSPPVLAFASEEIRADRELVLEAVRSRHTEYIHVGKALRQDYALLMEALRGAEVAAFPSRWEQFMESISEKFLENPEVACALVRANSQSYKVLPEETRENVEVRDAFIQSRLAFHIRARTPQAKGVQDILRLGFKYQITNRDLILEVVRKFGSWLQFGSESMRMDHHIVEIAVSNGLRLRDVHECLRLDHDIFLAAVKNDGSCLENVFGQETYATLLAEQEIALSALRVNTQNYKLLPPEAREDAKVKEEFVRLSMKSLKCRAAWYPMRRRLAVAHEGLAEILASGFIPALTNRELMLEIVSNFGFWLQLADEKLRKDRDVAILAVKNDGLALQYVHWALRADREVAISAVTSNGLALQHIHALFSAGTADTAMAETNALLLQDRFDIVAAAISQNPFAYRFAGDLQDDFSIISLTDRKCFEKGMSDKEIDKFFSIMARKLPGCRQDKAEGVKRRRAKQCHHQRV
jgi:hypothetical protein